MWCGAYAPQQALDIAETRSTKAVVGALYGLGAKTGWKEEHKKMHMKWHYIYDTGECPFF